MRTRNAYNDFEQAAMVTVNRSKGLIQDSPIKSMDRTISV